MGKTLNILHVSGATGWRGGEQQIVYLLKGFGSEVKSFLLAPKDSILLEKVADLPVTTFSYKKRMGADVNGAAALKKIIQEQDIDIVHLHDPHAHNIYAMAYTFWRIKTPAVLHRRVDFKTGSNVVSRYKYNLKGIKKIICVSEKVADILAPVVHDKNKRIRVIYSGIDVDRYHVEDKKYFLADVLQLPVGSRIIGNVAALADHKDHTTFISTAELLSVGNHTLYFVIAGIGEREKELRIEIKRRNLGKKVFLFGHTDDVPAFLASLDVFLYTSKEEGLGTAILEAMAAGVPVVATRAGGIPEIIQHEVNGLLSDVGDPHTLAALCREVLKNTVLRETMTSNATATAEKFSYEVTAKEVFSVYREIIPHA